MKLQLFNPFVTCIKWTEENDTAACDILALKKLEEQTLKCHFKLRNRRRLQFFLFNGIIQLPRIIIELFLLFKPYKTKKCIV